MLSLFFTNLWARNALKMASSMRTGSHIREKSNWPHPYVKPTNHNKDQHSKIKPIVQQWHIYPWGNQQIDLRPGKREIHAWYCTPSYLPIAGEVIDTRGESTIATVLN